jgi:hypothetical protein
MSQCLNISINPGPNITGLKVNNISIRMMKSRRGKRKGRCSDCGCSVKSINTREKDHDSRIFIEDKAPSSHILSLDIKANGNIPPSYKMSVLPIAHGDKMQSKSPRSCLSKKISNKKWLHLQDQGNR